jgi:DNA gyrase subunit A
MATNMPPHNLGEVIDGCLGLHRQPGDRGRGAHRDHPGARLPHGRLHHGPAGIRQAYATGRGSIVMRAKSEVEEIRKDREAIVFTEIPYQVNKATLIEKIADLVREKKVEGISDLRDESDRDGMRIVVELKRDAVADVVLNQLYRYTPCSRPSGPTWWR